MKSVGEAMAIGRTFKEALQKGLRSLETKRFGWGGDGRDVIEGRKISTPQALLKEIRSLKRNRRAKKWIRENIKTARPDRIFCLKYAFYAGLSIQDIYRDSAVDPWFLAQMKQLVDCEAELLQLAKRKKIHDLPPEKFRKAKEYESPPVQCAP